MGNDWHVWADFAGKMGRRYGSRSNRHDAYNLARVVAQRNVAVMLIWIYAPDGSVAAFKPDQLGEQYDRFVTTG